MAKKTTGGKVKTSRPRTKKSAGSAILPLTAAQRLAINTEIDRRIKRGELIEKETRLIGPQSLAMLAGLLPRVQPILQQRVRDFEHVHGRLPVEAMRKALLQHTLETFIYGFRLAAGASSNGRRTASIKGGNVTKASAEVRKQLILAAYDATDPSLSEAQRYATVKEATGIKSLTTIRKALRSR